MTQIRTETDRQATMAQWDAQQRAVASGILRDIAPLQADDLVLTGSETAWLPTGCSVKKGQHFSVSSTGANIVDRDHAVIIQPKYALWVRIGGHGPIRKIIFEKETVFCAWADGEVEAFTKALSLWADMDGAILPGPRDVSEGGIGVSVRLTDAPETNIQPPEHWAFMDIFGEVTIFSGSGTDISVDTHDGDCCILETPVDIPLNDRTRLSWSWLVDKLPSELPEDLVLTHDYISVAVRFDNGRDLTYMWSKELPADYHFACPLPWWCDRETHWIVESGTAKLGLWQDAVRPVASDYRKAIGDPLPGRVVAVWLIANSVFQRIGGKARFRNIRLSEDGTDRTVTAGSGLRCYSIG
ncbi:DUF3047 domain-containing protein (plasmid) [Komagataeibacter nataicola]|mgnify:CR=1 FL=1|uniref:DUF3047 domain-containing protein n=1 Tax=Komagataeibacter melomenusus TaxID=2766578 RepID=A0ABX2ABU4_9PROT|nr:MULTISPECIES: DUF3047 domain-containing protein [Komagataeibacter]MBV1830182.1 DUF3047 domain-containing protein [Komagataeibacter melomenusus]MBV0889184.1 DUF3047 domain-containing protein [Komagataeibacter oboediens]MCK9821246.1 DUF3047 domain-containing protein [Komagataeibacter oboediens]NPC65728.1 DUF3047 domain-containing protein [Komagataeibacter melomenusus]WEQ57501.1 DUF3047 domain-containing protein [Komagataeibacter nataicola]